MRCDLPKVGRQTQTKSLSAVICDLTFLCLVVGHVLYSFEKKEKQNDITGVLEDQLTQWENVGRCV